MKDSKKILICPACGKEMEKIPVPNYDLCLDICTDGCGGIWFDNRELKYFEEQSKDIEPIKKATENKEFQKVDPSTTRICPVCNTKMVKNNTGATGKVQIDECYCCGGKFFDYNEIIAMREEYKNNEERSQAALDLFKKMYGAEIRAHEKRLKDSSNSLWLKKF